MIALNFEAVVKEITLIGDKIREFRKAQGMTQGQLAERIGLTTAAVSNYETGVSSPSLKKLEKIAKALRTNVIALMHGVPLGDPEQLVETSSELYKTLEILIDTNARQQKTIEKLVDIITRR